MTDEAEDDQPIYERLPNESAKAYAAFCLYRDLPPNVRAIRTAYRSQPGREQANDYSGAWLNWAATYTWIDRVRAYDIATERAARQIKEAEHAKGLEAFRVRSLQLSQATGTIAVQVLIRTGKVLSEMSEKDITPKMLPAFLRAAAYISALSIEAEATALGLDELSALLEDNNDGT